MTWSKTVVLPLLLSTKTSCCASPSCCCWNKMCWIKEAKLWKSPWMVWIRMKYSVTLFHSCLSNLIIYRQLAKISIVFAVSQLWCSSNHKTLNNVHSVTNGSKFFWAHPPRAFLAPVITIYCNTLLIIILTATAHLLFSYIISCLHFFFFY